MKRSIFHVSIYEIEDSPKRYSFLNGLSMKFPTIEKAKEYALYLTTDHGNRGYFINEEVCEI